MSGHAGWSLLRQRLRAHHAPSTQSQWLVARRQIHLQHRAQALPRKPSPAWRWQRRFASDEVSTRQEVVGDAKSAVTRLKNFFFGTSIVLALSFTYLYVTDTRATIHQWLVVPLIRTAYPDAEDAHTAGNKALKGLYTFGLHPRERGDVDAKGDLKIEVFGHVLDNPIGTSAGIDKNAELSSPLFALGPAIVEVGGATPRPQEGNPKPRVWRVPSQNALINRYGLNSEGADNIAVRLRQRVREFAYSIGLGLDPEAERKVLDGEAGVPPGSLVPGRLLAVQCAKMKETPDGDIAAVAADYVYCVERLARYADIITVNVSSPNTPGLRSLQATGPLTAILTEVVAAAQKIDRKTKPAVMVKVSPDEDSDEQVQGICDAIWASGVDGVIVGNTTKKRPDPLPLGYRLPQREEQLMLEQGGYSGPQLHKRTVALVRKYRTTLNKGPPKEPEPSTPAKEDVSKEEKSPEAKPEPSQPAAPAPLLNSGKSDEEISREVDASIERDAKRLKPATQAAEDASKDQPLFQLPERHSRPEKASKTSSKAAAPAPTLAPKKPQTQHKEKVIFATGGITNGKEALEVLDAGASVAMVYTALVYGGAGTISRIKQEMREEIAASGKQNTAGSIVHY